MDSQSLTQLSQTSAEEQMRVLEIVLQIITLSTLVLFVTTLIIIIWLCLHERRQPPQGGPRTQGVHDQSAGFLVFIDPHVSDPSLCPWARAPAPWYATWAGRKFLRSR